MVTKLLQATNGKPYPLAQLHWYFGNIFYDDVTLSTNFMDIL